MLMPHTLPLDPPQVPTLGNEIIERYTTTMGEVVGALPLLMDELENHSITEQERQDLEQAIGAITAPLTSFLAEWRDEVNKWAEGFESENVMYGYAMLLPLFRSSCEESQATLLPVFNLSSARDNYHVQALPTWSEEASKSIKPDKHMIIPVNQGGSHWTFIVIDTLNKRIVYVNPSIRANCDVLEPNQPSTLRAEALKGHISSIIPDIAGYEYAESTFSVQGSDNNCGPYCVELMACFTRDLLDTLNTPERLEECLGPRTSRARNEWDSREFWEDAASNSPLMQSFAERMREKAPALIDTQYYEEAHLPKNGLDTEQMNAFGERRTKLMQEARKYHLDIWNGLLHLHHNASLKLEELVLSLWDERRRDEAISNIHRLATELGEQVDFFLATGVLEEASIDSEELGSGYTTEESEPSIDPPSIRSISPISIASSNGEVPHEVKNLHTQTTLNTHPQEDLPSQEKKQTNVNRCLIGLLGVVLSGGCIAAILLEAPIVITVIIALAIVASIAGAMATDKTFTDRIVNEQKSTGKSL